MTRQTNDPEIRILYVEDDDDSAYMLSRRLERLGYRVLLATDGEAGVAMARRENPDLIIMDLALPVMDGWEATRRLKQCAATNGIPIIAVSSHAMSGDRETALAAGCDDYDTKPVEFSGLTRRIRSLLSRRAS